MGAIDYSERIPNNVDLASDRRLRRALEAWQPAYVDWWQEMGPAGVQTQDIYLRTAISVDREGWAHYDYVKMPEYRWGIFLTPRNRIEASVSASTAESAPGRKCPVSTAVPFGESLSSRETPSPLR